METPRTLQEAIHYFTDFENCRQFMVAMRWPDGKVTCPKCNSEKVTYLAKARLYKCYGDHPKPKFSLKVGTVFEDSPIPLEKWLPAVWMLVNDKNGISSWELHRALGITQKSAWFMLHRIRVAMKGLTPKGPGRPPKLGGEGSEVEVDESFIGGQVKNMHRARRVKFAAEGGHAGGFTGKTIVQGMLDRNLREVRAHVVPDVKRETLQSQVLRHIKYGTKVYTDKAVAYDNLESKFIHDVVNHAETYVRGRVHTNGLENFWSLLKRGLKGTYVCVEPFHLERYVDEQVFRYNNRKTEDNPMNDGDRFRLALTQIIGKRLTYAELTGKTSERPL
jgi:transposase-like protein